jgi:carbonic anhydrase
VFLVAVPLSLGIAIASGAPLAAGLIAAAVGGIVAGALGGSAVQVSGPAAGLTVIVAGLVQQHGWRTTCAITMLAGVVQLGLGAVRVARAALAISPAVIHGMLAGVGVVITLSQLHIVLGGRPQSSSLANLAELPAQLVDNHTPDVAIGLLTVTILLGWGRLAAGRLAPLRRVPAPLVAVTAATAMAAAAGRGVERVRLPDSLADQWSGLALPAGRWQEIAFAVLTVALVASVESVLCAIAVDRMHSGPRAHLDRELAGQGAANIVSGLLGGLPVAGVIVRSTANVRAGGRGRASAVLHGIWVVAFVAGFAAIIELVPLSALAALLTVVGAQLVNVAHLRHARTHREGRVYVVTLLGVVALGLIEGVLLGMAVAVLVALRRLAHLTIRSRQHGAVRHVAVEGSLTFLGVPKLTKHLRRVPAGSRVELHLRLDFMDHAAFEAIRVWRHDHERGGGQVSIHEAHEDWYHQATTGTAPPTKTPPSGRSASPVEPARPDVGTAARR